ncbi:MAG: hypothetical protein Q8O75_03135 [bacterium]|nr:hypothetical protein [bacterium]
MEEKNNQETQVSLANGYLVAAGLTFIVFWITNILKESYPSVKEFLEFYKPIGPLLGLFALSLASLVIFSTVFQIIKIKNQNIAVWFFIISAVLFAIMVFPPVFEPIVHTLAVE